MINQLNEQELKEVLFQAPNEHYKQGEFVEINELEVEAAAACSGICNSGGGCEVG